MIDSNYLKLILAAVGSIIILTSLVDFRSLISKFVFRTKSVTTSVTGNKEEGFLEIISLWYQLKSKCDQFNLKVASDKLDEVFPLLSGALDNEKTA